MGLLLDAPAVINHIRMTWEPTVGTILVALFPRGYPRTGHATEITIEVGTRLEVIRVDETWDSVHAMIIQKYSLTVDLRVLSGALRGEVITDTSYGEVLACLGEEFHGYALPGWLTLPSPPVV